MSPVFIEHRLRAITAARSIQPRGKLVQYHRGRSAAAPILLFLSVEGATGSAFAVLSLFRGKFSLFRRNISLLWAEQRKRLYHIDCTGIIHVFSAPKRPITGKEKIPACSFTVIRPETGKIAPVQHSVAPVCDTHAMNWSDGQ